MISLLDSLNILGLLCTYSTCSYATSMLCFTFPNMSASLSNSITISITLIMKPPLTYNFITLFNILLSYTCVRLFMCLMVTNLSFLADMIINVFLLLNITSTVSVKNVCKFQKSSGIIMRSSISTLIGSFLVVFYFTPARSGPKIYILLLISCIVIGQFGRIVLLTIYLYSCSEGWLTIPCISPDSLTFYQTQHKSLFMLIM